MDPDGRLRLYDGYVYKLYIREGGEAPAPESGASKEAPAISAGADAFPGHWVMDEVLMESGKVKAEDAGLSISLEVRPDGSASFVAEGDEQKLSWTAEGDGFVLTDGKDPINARLLDDGGLEMSAQGMTMHFVKADVSPQAPAATEEASAADVPAPTQNPVPAQEPGPAPAADSSSLDPSRPDAYVGVPFVFTKVVASGIDVPLDNFEKYAVTFLEDGTAVMVIGGAEMPPVPYKVEGENLVVDYFGVPFVFRMVPGGLTQNYYDAMMIDYAPGR